MFKLSKQEIILGVVIGLFISFCIVGLTQTSKTQVNKARDLYKTALEYQKNKDYQSAFNTYIEISGNYPAYDMVLFQESKCAAALGDEKTVIKSLKSILSSHKDSRISPLASYNLAQAYLRIKEKNKAKKQFQFTIDSFPETDFAIGSYYYLGELNQETNPELSLKYWVDYVSKAPDGRFAAESLANIMKSANKLNAEEKVKVGRSLYLNQRYRDAYNLLSTASLKLSWYYLGKNTEKLGDYTTALNAYKAGISKYSSSFEQSQVEDAMLAIIRLNGKPAIDSWSEIIKTTTAGKDFAFYRKAQLIPYQNALELYKAIINYFPKGDYASESLWNLFWHEFNHENYENAINIGRKHIDMYTNKKASPKIMFWTAKAYERSNKKHLAKDFYKKLLETYPDSYYSFRASRRLNDLSFGDDAGWKTDNISLISTTESEPATPYSYNETKNKFGESIAELVEIGDYDLLDSLKLKDPFIDSWIKVKNGIYSKSIVSARDGLNELMPKPNVKDNRWKLVYPIHFGDIINEYSSTNNLDPFITLSLTKEESYFNPLAISSSNARGLMQLLPGTAGDISRWKNLGGINSLELFKPKKNIQFGTAYLGHIKGLLNNSNLFAVAAYNSGPGAVQKWLRNYNGSDMDQFVENIPYDQTRDYVKKVFGSYWNYKRIYASN